MRWNDEERRDAVRAVAWQRVLAIPAFLVLCLAQNAERTIPLIALSTLVLVVNVAELRMLVGPHWQRARLPLLLSCDAAAISLAMVLSNGGRSDARFLALTVVVASAISLPRPTLARVAAVNLLLISLPVIFDPNAEDRIGFLAVAVFCLGLAFTQSGLSDRAARQAREVAAQRRALLADALDAEHDARRDLAQDVHDRALQTLLTARQDLEEAVGGDEHALAAGRRQVDSAIDAVRDAVHELHVGALAGQLPQALHALVVRTGASGAVHTRARIEAGSGRHDELLYAVARELVADALDDHGATRLEIGLWRDEEHIVLEIVDDAARPDAGVQRRLGLRLATSSERLAQAGGSLWVSTPADGGTRVRARLPA